MAKETVRTAITDWEWLNKLLSVVQSTSDPTKYGLVICNPDWSPISWGGGWGWAVTSVNGQTWNVTWLQEVATVISWNTTASNDWVYVVVATATFTDPSPVEWKWFKVVVRNGTATVWWTGYAVAWSEILRIFHSWAWANYLKTPSSWVNTWDQTSIVGITWTLAEFNTALTGADFATLAWSEALTNKSVNGVTLVSWWTATKYLSEDGTYTTPAWWGWWWTYNPVLAQVFM